MSFWFSPKQTAEKSTEEEAREANNKVKDIPSNCLRPTLSLDFFSVERWLYLS